MLLKLTRHILTTTLLGALSVTAFAAGDREDYDLDDDGLIEINDLGDLDEIRKNLDGSSLYESSAGCPEAGCNGFELTTDLDFDTNGDGKMDDQDDYWNAGAGWEPIGDWGTRVAYSGNFDGNGYSISNLFINNSSIERGVGLFSFMDGRTNEARAIRNISFDGALTKVSGLDGVGVLVGGENGFNIKNIVVSGTVQGRDFVGVLAGEVENSELLNIFSSGSVRGGYYSGLLAGGIYDSSVIQVFVVGMVSSNQNGPYVGGLSGLAFDNILTDLMISVSVQGESAGALSGFGSGSSFKKMLTVGAVNDSSEADGIIGYSEDNTVDNSYWATDTTGQDLSDSENTIVNSFGATLAELKCPATPDNTTCAEEKNLYAGWSTDIWDFGTEEQLPGMIIGDIIFRDSDGDGNLDVNTQPSVSLRLTQDGTEETTIVAGEGDVTLEAIVSNLDLSERYKLAWSLEGIDGAVEFGDTITFNTDDLPLGDYTLSVTVTDSGYPQMSDTAEMAVRVISNIPEPEETPDTTEAPASKKKSSGGSAQWFWLVIAAMVFARRNRFAV